MPTKKEYLIEKGILQKGRGRGRWPAAAHEAIKEAINKGVKFTDGSENLSSGIAATAEPRFDRPDGYYEFQNADGRKFKRLHTSACVKCGYSFQWCYCENGPFQLEYLGITGQYAQLLTVPKRAIVAHVSAPPRRGRRRRAA